MPDRKPNLVSALGVFCLLVLAGLLAHLGPKLGYQYFYEHQVQQTVKDMVEPEALRENDGS